MGGQVFGLPQKQVSAWYHVACHPPDWEKKKAKLNPSCCKKRFSSHYTVQDRSVKWLCSRFGPFRFQVPDCKPFTGSVNFPHSAEVHLHRPGSNRAHL